MHQKTPCYINNWRQKTGLLVEATGSNTDCSMNFTPKMNVTELLDGYKKIIRNIYSVKPYYKRIRQFLLNYNKLKTSKKKMEFNHLLAFLNQSIYRNS